MKTELKSFLAWQPDRLSIIIIRGNLHSSEVSNGAEDAVRSVLINSLKFWLNNNHFSLLDKLQFAVDWQKHGITLFNVYLIMFLKLKLRLILKWCEKKTLQKFRNCNCNDSKKLKYHWQSKFRIRIDPADRNTLSGGGVLLLHVDSMPTLFHIFGTISHRQRDADVSSDYPRRGRDYTEVTTRATPVTNAGMQ